MTAHTITDDTGSRHKVALRPGLDLHMAAFTPRETLKTRFKTDAACLRFIFLREGRGYMDWRVSSGTAVSRKVRPIERSSWLSFDPGLEGNVCFPAGHRQAHFSIQVSPAVLNTLLGGRFQRVPYELQAILAGCYTIDFHHRGPLAPVMDAALNQIINCPYAGPLGLIYQEGKAIELIAHKLAQIESNPQAAPVLQKIYPEDIRRVRQARDLLMQNLENPPRLADLARAAGTSHTHLNRGFRKMYGTSVFGYLRQLRLEEARTLLEKGGMNVTEAAVAVGYNSISSFSRAFSAHFGSRPMNFLKKEQEYP